MMDQADAEDDAIDLDLLLERSHKVGSGNADGKDDAETEKAARKKLLRDLSEENNVADFDFSAPLVAGNVFEGRGYEKKEFVIGDDDEFCGSTKRTPAKRTRTETVDGLQFEVAVEEDPNLNFWQNCG